MALIRRSLIGAVQGAEGVAVHPGGRGDSAEGGAGFGEHGEVGAHVVGRDVLRYGDTTVSGV